MENREGLLCRVFLNMSRRIWEMSELYMFIESFTGFNYLGRFEEIGSIRGEKSTVSFSVVEAGFVAHASYWPCLTNELQAAATTANSIIANRLERETRRGLNHDLSTLRACQPCRSSNNAFNFLKTSM